MNKPRVTRHHCVVMPFPSNYDHMKNTFKSILPKISMTEYVRRGLMSRRNDHIPLAMLRLFGRGRPTAIAATYICLTSNMNIAACTCPLVERNTSKQSEIGIAPKVVFVTNSVNRISVIGAYI